MRLNDPAVLEEVTAAFQGYEKALNDNDVTTLTALFWKSPLTLRFGIGENLYGHDAITAFRHARPNIDLRRTLEGGVEEGVRLAVWVNFGSNVDKAALEALNVDMSGGSPANGMVTKEQLQTLCARADVTKIDHQAEMKLNKP